MGKVTASMMLERLKAIHIPIEAENAFNQEAYFAEDLNREQLMSGQGGDRLMPDYSPVSVRKYGKPAGGIRLYDKGDFQKGILYKADGDRITALSTDKKSEFLEDMYDYYKPLKLTPESKKDMGRQMQPVMAGSIGLKTGMKRK